MDVQVKKKTGRSMVGDKNTRWKGGRLQKVCIQCGSDYSVPRNQIKSRFCSLQCVGKSQIGRSVPHRLDPKKDKPSRMVSKLCLECGEEYKVFPSAAHKHYCCSRKCQGRRRSRLQSGEKNSNWNNGSSGFPYPFNWRKISASIKDRDGRVCKGPQCRKVDTRLTTHHIDFDKSNCDEKNLIALCSSCNTRANFDRPYWIGVYQELMRELYP